jgi:hypothetical protein
VNATAAAADLQRGQVADMLLSCRLGLLAVGKRIPLVHCVGPVGQPIAKGMNWM